MTKKLKKNKYVREFINLPSTEDLYNIADMLVEWSKKSSSLEFDEFSLSLGISPDNFFELKKKNKYFCDAYDFAMEVIANRLERLAKEGKLEKSFVLAILPLYKPAYKKWLLELKNKEQTSTNAKIVYITDDMIFSK